VSSATELEGDRYLDAIGDPDERNAAVHPEVPTVERHRALDLTGARAFPEQQGLRFGDASDGEVALNFEGLRSSWHDLLRNEGDERIALDVEEVLPPQRAVLEAAARIHARGLDPDPQHTRGDVGRWEGQGRVPLVERAFDGHGSAHGKGDRVGRPRHHEDGHILGSAG